MLKRSLKSLLKYFVLCPLLIFCSLVRPCFGQDIREIEGLLFGSIFNKYDPQLQKEIPTAVKSVKISGNLNQYTPEILEKLKNVEIVELSFDNQGAFENSIQLLDNFPKMKYLYLSGYTYSNNENINLPLNIVNYKDIEGIGIIGNWNLDLEHTFDILKGFQNLKYLTIRNQDAIPSTIKYFKNLQGLSLTSSKFTALPIEVAQLTKLESINLNLYNQKNSVNTINYAEALYKIQNLPNLKSISLVFSKDNIGDFGQLNFPNLQTLNLENINFNTHYNMVDFITNQKNLIKLHIKGQNFKNIDNRFENLINLTELHLSGQRGELTIQADLRKLNNLTSLRIRDFKLLPYSLKFPNNLKELDFSSTQLISMPQGILRLKKLEKLVLGFNKIQVVPPEIRNLKNLKWLDLSYNNLGQTKDVINFPPNLVTLWLNENDLIYLPNTIGYLPSLQFLDLDNNNLQNLPQSISGLHSLHYLYLSNNKLNTLPREIGKLSQLKKLVLDYNPIENLPDELGNLSALEELNLNNHKIATLPINYIAHFPQDLSNWKSLKSLILTGNAWLNSEQLFAGLFTIPSNIYRVNLSNSNINSLPDRGWEQFSGVQLDLNNNSIYHIPENIKLANNLSRVDLRNNNLPLKPTNLNQLSSSKYEKLIWFSDLGFFNLKDIRNDSGVSALIKKSTNHFINKEYQKAIEKLELAISIKPNFEASIEDFHAIGMSYYHSSNPKKAIAFLTKSIELELLKKSNGISYLNNSLKHRAKSYLILGDTTLAIKDYLTTTLRNQYFAELVLLYKQLGREKEASQLSNIAQIANQKRIVELRMFSSYNINQWELDLVNENFDKIIEQATEYEKTFATYTSKMAELNKLEIVLFFKTIAEIGNNTVDSTKLKTNIDYIKQNYSIFLNFELLENWLNFTKLDPLKVRQIREFIREIKD